jgi:hypothetical protein
MTAPDQAPLCANCDLDIWWQPIVVDGRTYCCGGCAQDGPCYCSYDLPVSMPQVRAETGPFSIYRYRAAANPQRDRVYRAGRAVAKEDAL